jgi:threonine/homoserine/homoserine lactone efflux protein
VGDVGQIVVYGLIAALSPVALLTTLAVLATRRARANGLAFAVGFVLGQTLALALAVVIGTISVRDRSDDVVSASFELGAGVLLILLGLRHRAASDPRHPVGGSRTAALLDRLADLTPRRAFAVGAVLGAGVKRVIVSLLAASTIALADVSDQEETKLAAIYVGVACALVVLPVAVYVIAGPRADELVRDSKTWLTENQGAAVRIGLLAFGGLFVVDAIVSLV